ncbi:hypothetical protein BDK51DRAFT_46651 [Blyttiomyces helicus]|uniref:Uncharacterized protein n=1 Tax=Blyttiomyces helicus TaxID=388810 RepID=A0A4V1IR23_9FUNG|nr:hypothetical protein BDK51DRAFT_46651 [Blyttiomyces helicus]|eukprot:RKO88557.1 hypothetical protein BDK51DRAFT_46651 [Blyttiomyces helicus]
MDFFASLPAELCILLSDRYLRGSGPELSQRGALWAVKFLWLDKIHLLDVSFPREQLKTLLSAAKSRPVSVVDGLLAPLVMGDSVFDSTRAASRERPELGKHQVEIVCGVLKDEGAGKTALMFCRRIIASILQHTASDDLSCTQAPGSSPAASWGDGMALILQSAIIAIKEFVDFDIVSGFVKLLRSFPPTVRLESRAFASTVLALCNMAKTKGVMPSDPDVQTLREMAESAGLMRRSILAALKGLARN